MSTPVSVGKWRDERRRARAAVRNDDGRFLNGFRRLFDHDAASHDAASDLVIFRVASFDCCCWRRPPGRPVCLPLARSRVPAFIARGTPPPPPQTIAKRTDPARPRARVPTIYSRLCSALVTGERFDPEIFACFLRCRTLATSSGKRMCK